MLDARECEIEFVDGSTEAQVANLIAESMCSQVDKDGRLFQLIKEIRDHWKDGMAMRIDDAFLTTKNGRQFWPQTT